jgi:hypothetical protein
MPLMRNVDVDTVRSIRSAGLTSAPTPWLQKIPAHATPTPQLDFKVLPEAALTSDYMLTVDAGTDIKTGDQASAINLPDTLIPWITLNANEFWLVVWTQNSSPGPLAHLKVFIKRITGGGTATS